MIETTEMKNARFEQFQGSPGESMSVDMATYGDNTDDAGSVGRPHDGEIGIKVFSNGLNVVVATHNYKIVITGLEKGEHQIFSYDADGNILSSAKCNKDGKFVINEGDRSATAFAELKSGFDQLKTDFNNLITAYNSHVHGGVTTGAGSSGPTPTQGVSSSADIDNSEVPEVLLP